MSNSFASEFRKSRGADDRLHLPDELASAYNVIECLSENEFGATLLLSDKADGKRFVLKICEKTNISSETNEAELLRGLSHKGLPAYKAAIEDAAEHILYILHEYVEGAALDTYMDERGGLGADSAVGIAVDLCGVLSYLHGRPAPIIHRDIKPSNIIISPGGNRATLIDFGISRKFSEKSDSDTSHFGTRKYAPSVDLCQGV